MRFIKKFEQFSSVNESDSPAVKEPVTKPTTKPGTKPNRPSPIRREKPSVTPKPKAKLTKATAEQVVSRFSKELENVGDTIKNYAK
jgi:hypothetical protein